MFWISFKYFQENNLLCEIAFPWFFFLIIFWPHLLLYYISMFIFFYFTLPSVSVKINLALLKIIWGKRFVNGCCWIKSFMSFYWIKTKKILSLFHHVALLGIDRHIYNAFFFYFMTKLKKSRKHFRTIELYIFFTMVLFYYPILFFEVNKLRVIRKVAANVSFCLILL